MSVGNRPACLTLKLSTQLDRDSGLVNWGQLTYIPSAFSMLSRTSDPAVQ